MKVTLLNSTSHPVEMLIFAKNTRLQMEPNLLVRYGEMKDSEKLAELDYISKTVKSAWEFVDFTFMIEGVSRAFTHQFVRNRQGSYAQQTMRMLDVSDFEYHTGPSIEHDIDALELYCDVMETINAAYQELLKIEGVKEEDARGILPTNILTNIMVKYNLRTLSELVASRSSPRTQSEFREVMAAMYQAVIAEHPWLALFLRDAKAIAAMELDEFIKGNVDGPEALSLIKLVDILRK